MKNKIMLGGNIFGYFTDSLQTEEIIQTARNLGIFAVDTADVYSEGLSEELIGKNIKADRSKWFVSTKAGLRSHESPAGLGRKENIFQKVENSLKRLKTDYIDLYQIHHFDPTVPLDETLQAFEQLILQGKILSAGVSNYQRENLSELRSSKLKVIKFHQTELNLTNYSLKKPSLQECADQNISILAYSSLVRGLFSEKYLLETIPQGSRAEISKNVRAALTPAFLDRLRHSAELCRKHDIALPGLALRWIGERQDVKWVITGVRSKEQLLSLQEITSGNFPSSLFNEAERIWNEFK